MKSKLCIKIAASLLIVVSAISASQEEALPVIEVQLYAKRTVSASEVAERELFNSNRQLCQNFGLTYGDHSVLVNVVALSKTEGKIIDWINYPPFALQNKIISERKAKGLDCNDPVFLENDLQEQKHPQYLPLTLFVEKKVGDVIDLEAYGCKVRATICELPEVTAVDFDLRDRKSYNYARIVVPVLLVCGGFGIIALLVKYFSTMLSN